MGKVLGEVLWGGARGWWYRVASQRGGGGEKTVVGVSGGLGEEVEGEVEQ